MKQECTMPDISWKPVPRRPRNEEERQFIQRSVDAMRDVFSSHPETTFEVEGWPGTADELEGQLGDGFVAWFRPYGSGDGGIFLAKYGDRMPKPVK